MAAKPTNPYAVSLTPEQQSTLGLWLANEVLNAQAAKAASDLEVDYWWAQYEQARTRSQDSLPWADAADLTSFIATDKVDALHARIMRSVWTQPVWTVEGYGDAADRAPFVEEFHQWQVERERLQSVLDKLTLTALVEPRGLLEISEASEVRTVRRTRTVQPQLDPVTQGLVFDERGQPVLQRNPGGDFVDATSQQPGVELVVDQAEPVRTGPDYRVIPYADSVILPGHARDKQEIWGYGKRIWKRKADLVRLAAQGVYDVEQVDRLTDVTDKQPTASLVRAKQSIVPEDPATAEKELWELLVLLDLRAVFESRNQEPPAGAESQGARWYLVTVHVLTHTLIRCDHDDFEHARYVPFILFPRSNRATEGYSAIGHKLISIIEEHTAYRNMAADRSALAVTAPILKLQGALWDEDEQPFGPQAVITVRDPREITPLQVPDVPASIFQHITRAEAAAERIMGVNDIASGQVATEQRTLGEIQMATEQSFVRMDLIVRRFQEAMEDVWQIRHMIWKRVLAANPLPAPPGMLSAGYEGSGDAIERYLPQGQITAALLEGSFRGRAYGSVETADLNKLRNDWIGMMQTLPMLLQAFPMLIPMFQSMKAARAMARQYLRVFRVQNTQAILGAPSQDLLAGQQPGGMPPPHQDPRMQADLQKAQLNAQLQIELQKMRNATAIEVAKIAASKNSADPNASQDELIALAMNQMHDVGMQANDHAHDMTMALMNQAQPPPPSVQNGPMPPPNGQVGA